jgi:hypothetical protein
MQPDPAARPVPAGLPPVTPPTGKFIVQLFLVPGLIVALIVGLLLLANWMFGGPRTPEAFLEKLDKSNADIRWRAASDLAQVLLRDRKLASDSGFALELASRLRRTIDASRTAEEEFARKADTLSEEDRKKERKKLEPDQNYIQFLIPCLGNFVTPAGGPLLKEIAVQEGGADAVATATRRRAALWALTTLGENLKRFDEMDEVGRDAVLGRLEQYAGDAKQNEWARSALAYLKDRSQGRPNAFGMDAVIEACAEADDPSLRYHAAFAANVWSGTAEENEGIDRTLTRLADDDGHGKDLLEALYDEEPEQHSLFGDNPTRTRVVENPGLLVRFNATVALARRGSRAVRLDRLEQMLDEDWLRQSLKLRSKSGPDRPNEPKVALVLVETLRAVVALHRLRPDLDYSRLRKAVERLQDASDPSVKAAAREAQEKLGGE